MNGVTPVRLPRARSLPPRQTWSWRGGLSAAYASEAGNGHARNGSPGRNGSGPEQSSDGVRVSMPDDD